MVGGVLRALIEGHDDVGAEADLRGHGALWAEEVRGAIEMRAKGDAFLGDFAQIVQAEHLEAAGIGEDRARPCHETVQASELADGLDSRTQIEVISVAEKNLNPEFLENILRHGFDGSYRAHGHEHGGLDGAVRRAEAADSGLLAGGLDVELDGHSC